MKRTILAALALLAAAPAAAGERAGQLGLGVLLGDPTSASAKYFVTETQAVDAGVGVSQTLTLHADWVWHGWDLAPQPKKGKLGASISLGGRLETQRDTDFGIRTLLGLSYWPSAFKRPAEFFLELGPVFRVAPEVRVRIDGGFGVRVYFSRVK